MPIYPSLEDMKATELIKAQVEAMRPVEVGYPVMPGYPSMPSASAPVPTMQRGVSGHSYPSLKDFLGYELSEEEIRLNMPEYLNNEMPPYPILNRDGTVARPANASIVPVTNNNASNVVAPISGSAIVLKSMVNHGVRQIELYKKSDKLGLRVRAMNTGIFVCLVTDNSLAAVAGLRFGDQILQIDGQDMAGSSVEKVHKILKKKKGGDNILFAVRDRPFERTVTLVKGSMGNIGFQFKDGKIINIVKDSSAARNGLLTDHALLEINGKNVIGLKDKEITKIIGEQPGNGLNVTIMPSFLYNHMVKEMASSLFGKMDHSNPDF